MNDIITLISTLGYPIVVGLICFWYINKKDDTENERQEKLLNVVENNTKVMQDVSTKLDIIYKRLEELEKSDQ